MRACVCVCVCVCVREREKENEKDLYAYSRVEQPLGCSKRFKWSGKEGEGTNFIHGVKKVKLFWAWLEKWLCPGVCEHSTE